MDLANALNPDQHEAAVHGTGPQLVLAGAGSGKTRVITHRIAWLVRERGVDPRSITAVTFTNKAAAEMRERVEQLLQRHPLPCFVGTFHRLALVMLRRWGPKVDLTHDFAIVDTADQKALIKRALREEGLDESSFPVNSVLGAIGRAKHKLIGSAAYAKQVDDFFHTRVAKVYKRYQKLLRDAGGVDFDDMIHLSVKLLEDEQVRRRMRERAEWLLVDEFQDTNHAQLRFVQALAGPGGNLTAVGDEDQGIYRWRGAELDNILDFERSFPDPAIRKLEQNYRSTQNILDAAGAVVAHNTGRRGKTLWTDRGAGTKIVLYRGKDEVDEARWVVNAIQSTDVPLGDSAILVRTNAATRAFEEELLGRRIQYNVVGGLRFYERAEIKDLIAYLRVLRNPRDFLSFSRVLNQPPRGIGKTTRELLEARAERTSTTPWDILLAGDLDGISKRGATALLAFRDLLKGMIDEAEHLPLPALLRHILDTTGYAKLYDKDDPDSQTRRENIDELLNAAQSFAEQRGYGSGAAVGSLEALAEGDDSLTAFLDHVSLVSDTDDFDPGGSVSLMTLHSAKGLEFGAVAIGGLEDGILPHFNAKQHSADIEEERRLLYVGMTRAETRLFLSCARRRRVAGRWQDQLPSPFLSEIPPRFLQIEEAASFSTPPGVPVRQAQDVYSFFKRPVPAGASSSGRGGSSPSPPRGERRVVYDTPNAGAGALRKGRRVRHASLGTGKIIDIEGSGDTMRLICIFEGKGRRKLVAKYANLELL
ncbi:MAG: UvrD-helicase domain-containing protein [Acidobacteriota bacterium]